MPKPCFVTIPLDGIEVDSTTNIVVVEEMKIETLMAFLNFAHVVAEKREVE